MTAHVRALGAASLALYGLTACTADGLSPRPTATIEAIESSVPDPSMQARWREAYDTGRLPSLAALPVPDRALVTPEPFPQLAEIEAGRPQLAAGTVPDVALIEGEQPVGTYRGPARVVAAEPGRLTLELPETGRQLEILVRAPQNQALSAPGARTVDALERVTLVVENQLSPRNSLQRQLHLATPEDEAGTVLFYLTEGGNAPYARTFDEPPLTIRQLAGAAQASVAPAEITYAGRQFRLLPGESVRAVDQGGPVEIALTASYAADPETSASDDGDPYHVTLMIFRLAE